MATTEGKTLSVSLDLDCPFLISLSVFSNVYLAYTSCAMRKNWTVFKNYN